MGSQRAGLPFSRPAWFHAAELGPALATDSVQFNMARLCGPMLAAALIVPSVSRVPSLSMACTFHSSVAALLPRHSETHPLRRAPSRFSIHHASRGLEIRLDESRGPRLTINGHDLICSWPRRCRDCCLCSPERAQGRPRTVRPDALSDRFGFRFWSLPAFVYSLLLPPPPPHPFWQCAFLPAIGLLFSLSTTLP